MPKGPDVLLALTCFGFLAPVPIHLVFGAVCSPCGPLWHLDLCLALSLSGVAYDVLSVGLVLYPSPAPRVSMPTSHGLAGFGPEGYGREAVWPARKREPNAPSLSVLCCFHSLREEVWTAERGTRLLSGLCSGAATALRMGSLFLICLKLCMGWQQP